MKKSTVIVNPRFSAISSELEADDDVSAMPKERFLALLDKDARKYSLEGPSADLGYLTDFTLLREKVKKYPWNDCAKFLGERAELVQRIETNKRSREKNNDGGDGYPGYPSIVNLSLDGVRGVTPQGFVGGRSERFVPPRISGMTLAPFEERWRDEASPERWFYQVRQRSIAGVAGDEVCTGFGPAWIVSELPMTLYAMPQRNARYSRLVIPGYCADDFLVHDVRAGKDSLFGSNPIPAAAFSERAVGLSFSLDVPVGLFVAITIQKTNRGQRKFSAMFFGVSL
jgi:hypothetical protein